MQSESTKKKFSKTTFSNIIIIAIVLLAGYLIGYARTIEYTKNLIYGIHSIRENNQSYHFIYPLLLTSYGQALKFLTDDDLQSKINDYIQTQKKNQNADDVSVVVRKFPDGGWVNINGSDQYHPGSMLKVLIMMAYYRIAEPDPSILDKNLIYTKESNQEATSLAFSQPTNLAIGQSYNVEQLLENMIENSDNGAEELLLENIDTKILDQAYIDLGVKSPDSVSGEYTISTSQYAGFIRVLYNSTYLSEKYSERTLQTMSKSTYNDGIVAGVPKGTTVAHKYGERVDSSSSTVDGVELHDCGIVYASNSITYELCVMTKGKDVSKLADAIKNISNIVYNHEVLDK
jgi:beta-lactamase class A